MPRMQYHFEPRTGWINDPNGLCWFRGEYHAFFQHNPYAPVWDRMHWGHAVSRDLLHWEELPIALYPDQPYENTGGCFSGSGIVKEDTLYLFYTGVFRDSTGVERQAQCLATTRDGKTFEKFPKNPLIPYPPEKNVVDFRDPKVTKIGDAYYMVCGSGWDNVGKVLLYHSEDLYHWDYTGVLFQNPDFGPVYECPDFFPFEDGFLLMFSSVYHQLHFVYGDFDGCRFVPKKEFMPERGWDVYAPQTFLTPDGRRVWIGWMDQFDREDVSGRSYRGAFSIPREITMREGGLCLYPVREAKNLLKPCHPLVHVSEKGVLLQCPGLDKEFTYEGPVEKVEILEDSGVIEVFINNGAVCYTLWYEKK